MILYTSNGEARQEFSIVVTARPLSGQPTPSVESSNVRWVLPSELPGYARPAANGPQNSGIVRGEIFPVTLFKIVFFTAHAQIITCLHTKPLFALSARGGYRSLGSPPAK